MGRRKGEGPVGGATNVEQIGSSRVPHFVPGSVCKRCGERLWRSQLPKRLAEAGRTMWAHGNCNTATAPLQHELDAFYRKQALDAGLREEVAARRDRDLREVTTSEEP